MREIEFAKQKLETGSNDLIGSGYLHVASCSGSHRYFIAETFAVEGEGTVGAVIVCTSCGDSKVAIHKVARFPSSISLKEK